MKIVSITLIVLFFAFVNIDEMGACTKYANPEQNDLGWCKEVKLGPSVYIGTCSKDNPRDPLGTNYCWFTLEPE